MSEVYVSSGAVAGERIAERLDLLVAAGYDAIEVSGGTSWYPSYEQDLRDRTRRHDLRVRLHNYFPPPPAHFALNLSAADADEAAQSRALVREALRLSARLGARRFGVHAGFRLQPAARELGRPMVRRPLLGWAEATSRFVDAWAELAPMAADLGIELSFENNVLSAANAATFPGELPFLAVDADSVQELLAATGGRLLLDVAHLWVSATSLALDPVEQLRRLWPLADYVHVSANDGRSDSNEPLPADGALVCALAGLDWAGKTTTIEVCGDPGGVRSSFDQVVAWTAAAHG